MFWLKLTYMTAGGEAGQTLIPEGAIIASWGNREAHPEWLLRHWTEKPYYKTLGDNAPTSIVSWEPATASLKAIDDIGLAYLIGTHDLTFSFSDDSRYYNNGRAELDRIHAVLRANPHLADSFQTCWNAMHLPPNPDAESLRMWGMTPERVKTILH